MLPNESLHLSFGSEAVSSNRALPGDLWADSLTAATCCNFALASLSLVLAVTALWAFGIFSPQFNSFVMLVKSLNRGNNRHSYEKPTCCAKTRKVLVAPEPQCLSILYPLRPR